MLYTIPILIGVTLITFSLFHLVGGDPALHYAGKNANPETIASLRHELRLDRPLFSQYLFYLRQTVTFDWGHSWTTQRPIRQMFLDGLGPSLCLTLPAFIFSVVLALVFALIAARYRDRWPDRLLTVACLALMSLSFLVYIIYMQKILAFDLSLFPIYGWDPGWIDRWPYLSLGWIIYVLVSLGPKILLYKAALIEELSQDYVRTAKAKGLSDVAVYGKHILKNAMIPILTFTLWQMPSLITGSLLLEAYFGIPGLGGMLMKAIHNSDFPVIQAMTVIGSLLYIFFNLVVDVLYAALDPRVELT